MPQLESSAAPIALEKNIPSLPVAAKLEWHALWTRSHCERLVGEQLAAKGFHPFVPTIQAWSTRGGKQHEIGVPMFPGYLFLPDVLDKHAYIEVRKSRGLVSLLGQSWDHLGVIPEREIKAIKQFQTAEVRTAPHPYLQRGRRVRVVQGPLTGCEGFLLQVNEAKGRLVVSVDLLQRSVSAEVDCSAVAPL